MNDLAALFDLIWNPIPGQFKSCAQQRGTAVRCIKGSFENSDPCTLCVFAQGWGEVAGFCEHVMNTRVPQNSSNFSLA